MIARFYIADFMITTIFNSFERFTFIMHRLLFLQLHLHIGHPNTPRPPPMTGEIKDELKLVSQGNRLISSIFVSSLHCDTYSIFFFAIRTASANHSLLLHLDYYSIPKRFFQQINGEQ